MTEVWTKWENQVVNGVFPLRRFLGKSKHSVVFLTEYKAREMPDAAIKLVPEEATQAETQLAYWTTAAELSHPHLISILDMGRCRLGGHPFLFLVMEYADETLAQVLPQRPLTGPEVRGMLPPALHALAYVHGNGLVHGQLKPPNILVVGDQVKLASDNLHPAGTARLRIAKPSPYDPPEAKLSGVDAAGDVWGLGMLVTEALTQQLPQWAEGTATATLPESLPSDFVDMLRRCISPSAADRPTLASLETQLTMAHAPQVVPPESPSEPLRESAPEPARESASAAASEPKSESATEPVRESALEPASAPRSESTPEPAREPALDPDSTRAMTTAPVPKATAKAMAKAAAAASAIEVLAGPATPAARPAPTVWRAPPLPPLPRRRQTGWTPIAMIILVAVAWAGWHHRHSTGQPSTASSPPPASSADQTESTADSPPPSGSPSASTAAVSAAPPAASTMAAAASRNTHPSDKPTLVVHQEIPVLARRSRESMSGIIEVDVRVTVDRSGKVVEETLENHGSNKYLELLSRQAARKWRFATYDHPDARAWLLQFEFSRTGTTANATPRS
jgi:serine/threonine-protein kinase